MMGKLDLFIKTRVHRSKIHYSNINHQGNEKSMYNFHWNYKKMRPPRHLIQLSIWKDGLGILDIDTQLNSLKTKWIHRLINRTNASWKILCCND